jgi:hypothetical protein
LGGPRIAVAREKKRKLDKLQKRFHKTIKEIDASDHGYKIKED